MLDAAVRATGDGPGARLIAADVGGTYARLGLVGVDADAGIQVLFHRRYACAEYAGLAAILRCFREECEAGQAGPFPAACVVAIAGVLQGDQLLNSNLPWKVSLAETRREAGIAHLHLINDFEALAWALPQVPVADLQVLGPGDGDHAGSGEFTDLFGIAFLAEAPQDRRQATEAGTGIAAMEQHADAAVGIHAHQPQPGIGAPHVRGDQPRAGSVPGRAHGDIHHWQLPWPTMRPPLRRLYRPRLHGRRRRACKTRSETTH